MDIQPIARARKGTGFLAAKIRANTQAKANRTVKTPEMPRKQEADKETADLYVDEVGSLPQACAPDELIEVRKAADIAIRAARKADDPADKAKLLQVWMQCRKMLPANPNQIIEIRPEWEKFLSSLRADYPIR